MRQKMKIWLAVLSVFVLVLQLGGQTVYAETISGDGGNLSITSDANYVYFTYEGSWKSYVSERITTSASGALSALSFTMDADKESGNVTIGNAWSGQISGASGTFTSSNKKESYGYENIEWTVKIPVSTYDSVGTDNMTFTWNNKAVTVPVKQEVTEATTEEVTSETTEEETTEETTEDTSETSTEETSETTEETTTEEATTEESSETTEDSIGVDIDTGGDIVATGGVQIDGMYDDWESYPKTVLEYHGYTSHYGQMFTDGEYIYAHFKAADNYTTHITITRWELRINGKDYAFRMLPVDGNGQVIGTDSPSQPGEYTNRKIFFDYSWNNICDSQVVYTIYSDGRGDDIEFRLSLESLAKYTGIPVDQMGTISIGHTNLGGYVTTAGSSTGPVAGVMVASLLALTYFKKKKEKRSL